MARTQRKVRLVRVGRRVYFAHLFCTRYIPEALFNNVAGASIREDVNI